VVLAVPGDVVHFPAMRLYLLAAVSLLACGPSRESADILITGGTVITMDAERRVIDDGAVAISGDRIVAVGPTAELRDRFNPREVIDARRKIIMPGLVDGHGHAGHGLVKTLGTDIRRWNEACEKIYARGSTADFWRADALLAGVERLKGGVTTSVTMFGGGDNVTRTDDVKYGDAYLDAIEDVGVRWTFAVGPRRAPFPKTYTNWEGETSQDVQVSFEKQMEVSEALITKWHNAGNGRVRLAVALPTHSPNDTLAPDAMQELRDQSRITRELSKKHNVLFVQDGHTTGTVKFAHELGLLGPDALLSHATELTAEEIQIVASTGTKIAHNPSAIFSIRGRSPVTELIDAGAVVMLGSDGPAPDRGYDMFRHMFQATRYHRFHFRDPSVLPVGKVLEMVTIDAARALGMEKDIGSLEAGKKADIILVDWFKPHLVPMNMPLYRMVYFANGEDVTTVLVDGRVLMRDRKVLTVDEEEVLTMAEREANAAIRRTGLEELFALPEGFWGQSRLTRTGAPAATPRP
jgi:5-methylthioadenosine/S-adenosylhomocysteine deaminase